MRKTVALVVLVLALIVAPVTPSANAITGNGVVSDRDNVVLLTFYDEQGVYLWRCSGTLIAPTIVLTAGHCTYGAAEARVWADQGPYVETPVDEGGYPLSPVEDRPPCDGYLGFPCMGEDATGEPLTYPGMKNLAHLLHLRLQHRKLGLDTLDLREQRLGSHGLPPLL